MHLVGYLIVVLILPNILAMVIVRRQILIEVMIVDFLNASVLHNIVLSLFRQTFNITDQSLIFSLDLTDMLVKIFMQVILPFVKTVRSRFGGLVGISIEFILAKPMEQSFILASIIMSMEGYPHLRIYRGLILRQIQFMNFARFIKVI